MFIYYLYKSIYIIKKYSYVSKHVSIFLNVRRGSVFIYNINQISPSITHFSYYINRILLLLTFFYLLQKTIVAQKLVLLLEGVGVDRREMGKEEANSRFSCNCKPI